LFEVRVDHERAHVVPGDEVERRLQGADAEIGGDRDRVRRQR